MDSQDALKKTTACRDCEHEVSLSAPRCPHCGAPYPHKPEWDGWGIEWKSRAELLGWPLVHVSFKYRPTGHPVVAKGWLAIGQFSVGFLNISQFGLGPLALSQFAIAGAAISQGSLALVALAQMTIALFGVCQMGVVYKGFGQLVLKLSELL